MENVRVGIVGSLDYLCAGRTGNNRGSSREAAVFIGGYRGRACYACLAILRYRYRAVRLVASTAHSDRSRNLTGSGIYGHGVVGGEVSGI